MLNSKGVERKTWRLSNHMPEYSNSSIGAMNEMRVAVDLILRGYEVFRALDPSASCDLVALKDGKCLRVQVKTATVYKYADGGTKLICNRESPDRYDLLAIVNRENQNITYESAFGEDITLEAQQQAA